MKLFVKSKKNKKTKIYLKRTAKSRQSLANKIGGGYFVIRGEKYSVNDVYAAKEGSDTASGAVIGGILGLVGGPIGFLTGGTIGGMIGNSSDSKEAEEVRIFNGSWYEKGK
jgi:hypothetical protein